ITHRLDAELLDAHLLQRLANITVTDLEPRRPVQAESYAGDEQLVFEAVLEDALAVAEFAFCARERRGLGGVDTQRIDRLADRFHLDAVRTDILHRRGAHLAGNQRQVLDAGPTTLDAVQHELVPHDTGADAYPDVLRVFAYEVDAGERVLDD